MFANKSYPLLFFIIFQLLFTPSFSHDSHSSEILYEIEPFIKVYKNGSFERLSGTETVPPSLNSNSRVLSKDVIIDPTLNISARLFRPNTAARKLPLLVYFHGGAFFTESPFSPTYHNYLNYVVSKANIVAVSVNYRLAPEYLLPTAYQDCWLALKWVFSHSNGNGNEKWLRNDVDFGHVYLGGDSAGGNIAHNVAMRVGMEKMECDDKGIMVHGLFLNCPHFWGSTRIGNEASFPKVMIETEESIWIHANPSSSGFDDPASNPGKDPNLWKLGCKKVLVYVAGNDVLKERGLYYAKVLKESGWRGGVKSVEVKGENHVFNLKFPYNRDAREMMGNVALFLNDRLKLSHNMYTSN